MTRRRVIVLGLLALVVAAVVFRHQLERAVLVTVTGWVCWRLVVGRRPRRRVRGGWARWVEALSLAWIASHMPARAKRERIRASDVVPIGSLRPVYGGPDPDRRRPRKSAGPGDEIPF